MREMSVKENAGEPGENDPYSRGIGTGRPWSGGGKLGGGKLWGGGGGDGGPSMVRTSKRIAHVDHSGYMYFCVDNGI